MNNANPNLITKLRALPRAAWILFLGTFLNKFGTFVIPFLAIYLTRKGFSTAEAAVALGAYGAGHFIASGLGGYLADRIGRRKTIVLSMFSAAVAMLLLSQAQTFLAVVVLTLLAGLGGELYRPAGSALLADLVPQGQRVTAFAIYRMAFNAGWVFGPAIAGFLTKTSYLWLFVGDAITSILFGIVAWFALPHGIRASKDESGWPEALKVIAVDRRFQQFLIASIAIGFVFFQMSSTFGLHLTRKGISETWYGLILSLNGLLVVAFELLITTYSQRFPAPKAMAFGFVLIGVGFASNAFASSVPAFALAMIVFTAGEMAAMPVASAYVADLAPEHMRGRYLGMNGFVWALALAFGPSLGVLVYERSPTGLWLTCGALGLFAAFVISRPARVSASVPTIAGEVKTVR
jgi:MFS family permease